MFKKAFLSLFLLILGLAAIPAQAGSGVLTPIGPGKGSLGAIAVHPSSPGQVWIGIPAEGVARSDDQGATWKWAGRPLAGWPVEGLTSDPTRPGALWAANANGLYHTADGGAHWQRITDTALVTALAGAAPRKAAVVGENLYIQTYRRLLASRNGGQTWEVLFESADGDALIDFGAGPAGLFLATGGSSGIQLLKSADSGLPWAPVPGDWRNSYGIRQIEVTPAGVYVVADFDADTGSQEGRLLRSLDGGATWQRILAGSGGWFNVGALAVDARTPRTLWALAQTRGGPYDLTETRLWVSRDGGTTWRRRGPAVSGTSLTLEPGTSVLYASSYESLWRTLDGGRTWQQVVNRMDGESPPSQVIFQPGNPARMALVIVNRLVWTQDGGLSWSMPAPELLLGDVDIDPGNPRRWLKVGGPWVDTSLDAGRTWSPGRTYLPEPSYVDQLIRIDRKTIFAGGCGLNRSVDNGQTWQSSLPCSTRYAPNTGRFLRKLVADPADPGKLYALTAQVEDFYANYDTLHEWPSILWQSSDGGRTWRKIANNLKAIAVSPTGGRIYAIRGLDLLASDDAGKTWHTQAHLPKEAYDLTVRKDDPDAFFALSGAGVLYSANGGGTWTQFQTVLDPSYYEVGWLSALVPHPKDPRTVFVTSHGAVFHLRVP